ncbi:MAG: MazG nucleotide pyrophosphohydrolase domain-containing protein [Gemmatimonadaceae bacterium]|nr:MazG nucleotide pyrophosphohydrolase domain-containing protein [Gemmatimonadaceae bacterium]
MSRYPASPRDPVDFDSYQTLATRTLNPALDADARLLDAAAGLAEEAGEVLGAVRKHLFQQRPLDHSALTRELGDALWCLSAVATSIGVSLGDVAHTNLDKLRARYADGFSVEASHERVDERASQERARDDHVSR